MVHISSYTRLGEVGFLTTPEHPGIFFTCI